MKPLQATIAIAIAIAIAGPALAAQQPEATIIAPELAAPAPGQRVDTSGNPPRKAIPMCEAVPHKCSVAPIPCPGCAALGLVCCGDGWCLAVATNSDCGPANDLYSCAWGATTTGPSGLPDVECYD